MRRRRQGVPRRELATRISTAEAGPLLPLVHTTQTGFARDIVEDGSLLASDCKALPGSPRLYFFFGKPAYRSKEDSVGSAHLGHFPFVFLVDPETIDTPIHVFPFDTGAALGGRYDVAADRTVPFDDYGLLPNLDSARQMLGWAFATIDDYLSGEVRADRSQTVPPHDLTTTSFLRIAQLARSTHNDLETYDGRASAIEVCLSLNVSLAQSVDMVIVPDALLDEGLETENTAVIDRLRALGIRWKTYHWSPNLTPAEFHAEIESIVRTYVEAFTA